MTARLGVVRPATPRTTMLKTSGLISPQEAAAIERTKGRPFSVMMKLSPLKSTSPS